MVSQNKSNTYQIVSTVAQNHYFGYGPSKGDMETTVRSNYVSGSQKPQMAALKTLV